MTLRDSVGSADPCPLSSQRLGIGPLCARRRQKGVVDVGAGFLSPVPSGARAEATMRPLSRAGGLKDCLREVGIESSGAARYAASARLPYWLSW